MSCDWIEEEIKQLRQSHQDQSGEEWFFSGEERQQSPECAQGPQSSNDKTTQEWHADTQDCFRKETVLWEPAGLDS